MRKPAPRGGSAVSAPTSPSRQPENASVWARHDDGLSRGRARGARVGRAVPRARRRAARALAGRARIPSLAVAGVASGSGGTVLGRAPRRRGDPPAGDDALAVAALLRLLR